MRYLRNIKNSVKVIKKLRGLAKPASAPQKRRPMVAAISTLLLAVTIFSTSACMDKLPKTIRQTEQYGRQQYYGFRADKWDEIEASYEGGKAACCGANKFDNDDIRALELFCKGAMAGHRPSQIEVGRFYAHQAGAGLQTAVPYDNALAYAYYDLASADNYPFANAMKESLLPKLTAAEKSRADQLVKEFPNIPCEITR